MEEVCEHDDACSCVKGGCERFVFMEEHRCHQNAIDGLEVDGEIHGVGRDGWQ